jgi:hypothetical protein
MEKNISDKLEELLNANQPGNIKTEEFVKASEVYQKLIEMGLTQKRGFSILTTEEIYLSTSRNSYCQSPV